MDGICRHLREVPGSKSRFGAEANVKYVGHRLANRVIKIKRPFLIEGPSELEVQLVPLEVES